ncbi:MAG: DNA-binding protein [Actinomycetota bacterium]|nr:DNA-binding protein [Actinomycetota bacterium]
MGETRIQLCGRLVARIDGHRVEGELPGRQGRLAFAFLTVNRHRPVPRDELANALWAEPGASDRLSPLLSKLRTAVPLDGRGEVRLALPDCAWIDVEAASESLHRAESAVAKGDFAGAWGPGRVAQHVTARAFLPGEDAPWIDEQRRRLEEILIRSLELVGRACVEIGGGELDTAERAARSLIARAPYRESGHRLLMETLAARGNAAEALLVYDRLRHRLRDVLGAAPSAPTQELHRRLLG